jgi:hypothetical protein
MDGSNQSVATGMNVYTAFAGRAAQNVLLYKTSYNEKIHCFIFLT